MVKICYVTQEILSNVYALFCYRLNICHEDSLKLCTSPSNTITFACVSFYSAVGVVMFCFVFQIIWFPVK